MEIFKHWKKWKHKISRFMGYREAAPRVSGLRAGSTYSHQNSNQANRTISIQQGCSEEQTFFSKFLEGNKFK